MFEHRILIFISIYIASTSVAQAQGRSGRDRGQRGPKAVQNQIERRVPARVNQRVQQQAQRRVTEGATRAAERRAAAAARAAQAAARRVARDAAAGKSDVHRFANARGVRPEVVATKAAEHADVHAVIAAGLVTGEPLHFTESQRGQVAEVFGDAGLLDARTENRSRGNGRQKRLTDQPGRGNPTAVKAAPGSNANVRARLGNAIRIRRAQISELRDRAIDSGDAKLLERADRLEKTLDIFLRNQARVEANLAEVAARSRDLIPTSPDVNDASEGSVVPRTADAAIDDGLIEGSTGTGEARLQ